MCPGERSWGVPVFSLFPCANRAVSHLLSKYNSGISGKTKHAAGSGELLII